MKLLPLLLFSLLASVPLAAIAQDEGRRKIGTQTVLPDFLKQFDVDGNGELSVEERQAIRDYRRDSTRKPSNNNLDLDDDGQISPEEIQAAKQEIRQRIEDRRQQNFLEIAGEDELISREEFLTIPGMVDLSDWLVDAFFNRLDADRSGDIDKDEFLLRLRPTFPIGRPPELSPTPGLEIPNLPDSPGKPEPPVDPDEPGEQK